MTKDVLQAQLEAIDASAVLMDGYDAAIIGYNSNIAEDDDGNLKTSVIYSYSKCLQALVDGGCETVEEAKEYFDFNTLRALDYLPDPKPIIVIDEEV